MALALMFALQAAGLPAPAAVPPDFDLAKVTPSEDDSDPYRPRACRGAAPGEIVVCGRRRRDNDYPLEERKRLYREKPLRAEVDLGGGVTGRSYIEQVEMPQGQVSKRIMFGIRMPF